MFTEIWQRSLSYFDKLIISIIILLIGLVIGLLIKKIAERVLREVDYNGIVRKMGITVNAEKITGTLLSYAAYAATIFLLLDWWGIAFIVFNLIVGGLVLLAGLGLITGLKDVIPNFLAGWKLKKNKELARGKKIEIQGINGVIEKMGYLKVILRTGKEDILHVPNAFFVKGK